MPELVFPTVSQLFLRADSGISPKQLSFLTDDPEDDLVIADRNPLLKSATNRCDETADVTDLALSTDGHRNIHPC